MNKISKKIVRAVRIMAAAALLLCVSCGGDDDNNNDANPDGDIEGVLSEEEWVDLGLPSGLQWASCNLGASSPEEYGDYYAWGETSTKSVYSWSNYSYSIAEGDSLIELTKYNTDSSWGRVDNLTKLMGEDDAATTTLGSEARTPTAAEWRELLDNTVGKWTRVNGVLGRMFIGANGVSIFLPAAGSIMGGEFYDAGSDGLYWSSSLSKKQPYLARGFCFFSRGSMNGQDVIYVGRATGLPLRPVRSVR